MRTVNLEVETPNLGVSSIDASYPEIMERFMEIRDTSSPEITEVEPVPGVGVCYMTIPSFIGECLVANNYTNFSTKKNLIFDTKSFHTQFLSTVEIDRVNRFRSLKKQVEWMAGRFLVKRMIKTKVDNQATLTKIFIDHQDQGAPFLRGYPQVKISISHSGDYAGAALTTRADLDLGLDIEQIEKPPGQGFMRIAFTQREINAMGPQAKDIFRCWTVKEAFLKLIKKGFNQNLHQVEVIGDVIVFKKEKTDVKVISTTIGTEYAVSIVIGTPKVNYSPLKERDCALSLFNGQRCIPQIGGS